MSFKKLLCLLFSVLFIVGASFTAGCKEKNTDDGSLNIIDDNYRNWYEIFVFSYFDTNNDGYGDLKGVEQKLDYISEMGYNGIWFMPVCQSETYHKYDVVDYYTIDKIYGTNQDFKDLVASAHSKGINIIVDLVLNHSSSSHEWFRKASNALRTGETTGENAKYIEYYNFATSAKTGYRSLGGTSYYYESRFSENMPDLNLDSQAVRQEIADIIEFWLTDMDVDGFRLDACTSYYTGNVSKNVEFLSFVNQTAKSVKSDAYIVGEVWEGTDTQIRAYYESGIDSCFTFTASQGGGTIRSAMSDLKNHPGDDFIDLLVNYQKTYNKGSMAPFLCNHDTARAGKFLIGDTVKMGAGLLSVMNGNVFVYYGDEIGMINKNDDHDPSKRIAMKWQKKNVYPGLTYQNPDGYLVDSSSYKYPSVEEQQADPNSILNYYKQAMRMRNRNPEIARGVIEKLPTSDDYVGVMKKTYNGSSIVIMINLSSYESKTIDISSYGNKLAIRDQLCVSGNCTLKNNEVTMPPYSIVVLK
ncbi:MAG: alpha amylase [Clostridia bacterium]|nr:alpha amylase [Clostridia bacterium]